MNAKEVLGALSFKFDGNWERLYEVLKNKERITDDEIKNFCSKITTNYIYLTSKEYPRFLVNEISCPPIVLYYKGDINLLCERDKNRYIGIVGSRNATEYGKKSVSDIVKGLPKDMVVVSGLARGIDKEAHESALDYGLKTIAVLGCGIDYIYPAENVALYKRIIDEGGLILSEYPCSVKPNPENFVFRNRIIASLSEFLLIGEAYDRSGSSTTVNYALQGGKTIGCIPYPRSSKSLCNKLIRDGAVLIENASDVLLEMGRKN